MMHNNNNKNRNNNNRRFSKNNNNNFKKRRFGSGSSHIEDEQQISPQQRRNFENKMQQHLQKAKEYLAAGERIEAENHFQYADHYFRMSSIGLDKLQQQQQQQQNNNYNNEDGQQDGNYSEGQNYDEPVISDAPEGAPEIPVDMMGNFPSNNQHAGQDRHERSNNNQRYRDNNRGGNYRNRDNRNENRQDRNAEPRLPVAEAPASEHVNDIATLPFMQTPIKES